MRPIRRSVSLSILLFAISSAMTLHSLAVSADIASEATQLLRLINQERTSRNIPELTPNTLLLQVAQNYSREMMEHGFIGHVSQVDGSTLWDRIKRSGYYDGYNGKVAIRENIALISGPARATAAHQAFMNSEGHRENLLAPDVNEIGIGITEGIFQSIFSTIYVEVFAYHTREQQVILLVSINPTTMTVRRGERATYGIHIESSVPTTVTIEVVNLGSSIGWNLSSSLGMTPLDTILTLDTRSASEGIYPFNIVIRGAGQTKTLSATLNIIVPTQTTTQTTTKATSSSTSITSRTVTSSTSFAQTATNTTRIKTLNTTQTVNTITSSQTTLSTFAGASTAITTAQQTITQSTMHTSTLIPSTSTTRNTVYHFPTYRCVIATAAFGSKLSPKVQYLRQFRDQKVMLSFNGRMFMSAFNAAYYSFSPRIAEVIAENEQAAMAVRAVISPLIFVLRVSSLGLDSFPNHVEAMVLLCGLLASSLIGLIYLFPVAIILDLNKKVTQQ